MNSAIEALPETAYGSSTALSEYFSSSAGLSLAHVDLAHRPAGEAPLADLLVAEQDDVVVARVVGDPVVERADRVASAFEHLQEDVRVAQKHSTPVTPTLGVVRLERFRIALRHRLDRLAARLAYISRTSMRPPQTFLVSSDRNSRRRFASFRNAPRMTLLVIIDSSSLTPRQCMQK